MIGTIELSTMKLISKQWKILQRKTPSKVLPHDKFSTRELWSMGAFPNLGAGVGADTGLGNFWNSRMRVRRGAVIKKLLKIFLYSEFNIFFIYKNSNKRVEFIIKKKIIYDLFLIKSIFLVIVNKKPPFKKVPLLLFQFSSLPTWNNDFLNYLIYILLLYTFILLPHLF